MLPYGASRDVSTDHENQLDGNRRTLVSLLPASTRLPIILNAFHAVFDLISSVIITSGIVLVFKNISNFSNWIEEMIPINLERVWKNNFLEKIFRMFNYIYSSWKKKMNFIFYHIESKWNLDGNFSILNCRFKGIRPRILIFISFDPLRSSCFSQTNHSLALSRERKFTYITGSRYPTVLVSGTENDNLFVFAVSRLHILNDCHQDTPSMFILSSLSRYTVSVPLSFIINLFWQFLKRLEFARCARNLHSQFRSIMYFQKSFF